MLRACFLSQFFFKRDGPKAAREFRHQCLVERKIQLYHTLYYIVLCHAVIPLALVLEILLGENFYMSYTIRHDKV